MGEAEQQQTPSERLLQALQVYVREVAVAPALGHPIAAAGEAPPTWKDIFFFLLFACNLALIVWSVPEEWVKSAQLEFLQKVIPVIGAGLFTLIAAWFKDHALAWTRNRKFRISQIPLTALAVTLAVEILPLRVVAQPEDAVLYLDKQDDRHLKEWKKNFRVTLGNHSFILKHHDQQQTITPVFERNWAELVWLSLTGEPIELNLVCPYRFRSPQTHGVTIDITRKDRRPFSKDFLRDDLIKNGGLQKIDDHTLRLNPRGLDDNSEPTQLPAGEYTAIAMKNNCTASAPVPFTVGTASHANLTNWEFPKLICTQ